MNIIFIFTLFYFTSFLLFLGYTGRKFQFPVSIFLHFLNFLGLDLIFIYLFLILSFFSFFFLLSFLALSLIFLFHRLVIFLIEKWGLKTVSLTNTFIFLMNLIYLLISNLLLLLTFLTLFTS